jgi:hypothetical protein
MKKNTLLLTCAAHLLIAVFANAQNIQPVWARLDNAHSDGLYGAPFLHLDSEGNAIVCGSDYNPGPLLSFLTTKYSSNGQMLWQQKFDLPGNDFLISSLCDAQNAVYVAGNTGMNSIMAAVPGMVLLKYAADGSLAWSYRHEGAHIGQNYVTKILFDADQNVVVFGNYTHLELLKTGLFAVKLSPEGQVLWSASHVDEDFGYVGVGAKRVGGRWAFWGKNVGTADTRYLAWQLADDGQTLASAQTGLNVAHAPEAVHLGDDGSLYVSTWVKYQVLKFGLDGQKQWEYDKPNNLPLPPQGVKARVNAIATDNDGNTFVYGSFRQLDGLQLHCMKISPVGSLEWEHSTLLNDNRVLPNSVSWLNDSVMIVVSSVYTVSDSNFYEFAFLMYDRDGFVSAWSSDVEGRRNAPKNMAKTGDFLYVAGIADKSTPTDLRRQILSKYAMDDIRALVSAQEMPVRETLSLWPNPAANWAQLSVPANAGGSQLVLRDAAGRLLREWPVPEGQTEAKIDLEGLPPGFYLLSLSAADGRGGVGKLLKR